MLVPQSLHRMKTLSHLTVYINVDIDVTSPDYGGIELLISWDGTKYNVAITQATESVN